MRGKRAAAVGMGTGRWHAKRLLAVAVVTGFAAACGGGSGGGGKATLTVNDADFRGVTGDDLLSLSEAIELASGRRLLGDLSTAEQTQVDGMPGFGRRDVIRFNRSLSAIQVRRRDTPVAAILPRLDDPGDAIEGGGVRLDGRLMDGEPQLALGQQLGLTDDTFGPISSAPLLLVAGSGVRVTGLVIDNVPATAFVVQGAGDHGVRDVRIEGNEIRGPGQNTPFEGIAVVAGSNTSDQRLSEVEILDNTIQDIGTGIAVRGGAAAGLGESARRNRAESIRIRGNRVQRTLSGIVAVAAQAALSAQASDNLLRDLEISENEIAETLDVGIRTAATNVLDGSTTSDNEIDGVRITANSVQSSTALQRLNTGMSHTASRVFARGSSADDRYTDLTLESNVVDGYATGLFLAGAHAERCGDGCDISDALFGQITIHDNAWRNLEEGIVVAAGSATESAALVRDNVLRGITMERETVAADQAGMLLAAGIAVGLEPGGPYLASSITFPGFQLPGQVRDNELRDVSLAISRITGSDGIVGSGGTAIDTEDTVSGSALLDVFFQRVVIASNDPQLSVIGGRVVGAGSVRDCLVDNVRSQASENDVGAPISLAIVDQIAEDGAPAGGVQGNQAGEVVRE